MTQQHILATQSRNVTAGAFPLREIVQRTRGNRDGPITRLMSPGDLGEVLKPFVFLDLFDMERTSFPGLGLHPHSGIATVTYLFEGDVRYEDTSGATGILTKGGVEWFKAGHGAWHGGGPGDSGRTRGFQLWVALPPEHELTAVESVYQAPEAVKRDGPARVLVGTYGGVASPLNAPVSMNYLAVRLKAGEFWSYQPPAGHTVGWIALATGHLLTPESVEAGELAIFEPSHGAIDVHAEADTEFVLGSSWPHPYDLVLGSHSVHTSPAALQAAEQRISEIKRRLKACWSTTILASNGLVLGTFSRMLLSSASGVPMVYAAGSNLALSLRETRKVGSPAGTWLLTDIDDRKRAEDALRSNEESLRLTIDSIPGFVSIANAAGEVELVNRQVLEYFGKTTEELKNWATSDAIHPDDLPRMIDAYRRSIETGQPLDVENRCRRSDGVYRWFHVRGRPQRDAEGRIVRWYNLVTDIEESKRAEYELERAFEEIKRLKDRLHDENVVLREEIDQAFMFEEIVGSSPALKTVLSSIVKVALTDSTVLITGETGTGKELIARAIHKRSHRAGQAFISVNCAAIPSSLIASELFGHEKGAFTGALQRRQGRFELAHSGTIFLDEIGELPAETQIALLRVIQERQFERVGGTRVIHTDVRIIAASNRDLAAALASGIFRDDLFYRLNVFPIHVPPLRNRKEDIPMLVEYFVKRYADKARKQISKIDRNTLQLCKSYHWPGNIRELQNIIERSVILCTGDTFWIDEAWLSRQNAPHLVSSGPLKENLQNYEKELIEVALAESDGKVAGPNGAAAKLGIPRSTLDLKIKQLNMKKHTIQ